MPHGFTSSKVNALVNITNSKNTAAIVPPSKPSIEQLIQVKEDALKFITQLEKGWIARQEKLSMLTPRQSNKKRYELEQWVTS